MEWRAPVAAPPDRGAIFDPAPATARTSWLEREWPSAAASLREGLSELFTVNRLGLPKPLRRCLTTTNIIDSSHAGVRQHANRVSRWQSEEMAVRWAAVTFRETDRRGRLPLPRLWLPPPAACGGAGGGA